jgi:FkbM family methyltransferase
MRNTISWLLKEEKPTAGVLPTFDRFILFFLKLIYLSIRNLLRIFLGKKRRDGIYIRYRLSFNNYFSPSFYFFMYLYKTIKLFRLANPTLLKISLPKYDYKLYFPISKEDFKNMTMYENDIIEQHFAPKEGDTVVDVGAHIGRYTIISSKRVGPTGKVLAIEANPTNFEILGRNIKLNQLNNVIALNYAAYSRETKIKLYLPGEEKGKRKQGHGTTTTVYNTIMLDRANAKEDKYLEVNADTLDNLLQQNGIGQVNWIKIDVEGAELEVLKGAINILSKSKDIALLIEVHNLHGGTNLYTPIRDVLNSYNFEIEYEKTHQGGEKHVIVRKL